MKTFSQKQFLDWAKNQPTDRLVDMSTGNTRVENPCVLAQFFKSRRSLISKNCIARTTGYLYSFEKDIEVARVDVGIDVFQLFENDFILQKTFGELMKRLRPEYI